MADLKYKRFRHSKAFRNKLSENSLDITLDSRLSGQLCVQKLCSVGKLKRLQNLQNKYKSFKPKFSSINSPKGHKTKSRIQNKSSIEKTALQGLCLMKDHLFIPDLYDYKNRKNNDSHNRKRKRSHFDRKTYSQSSSSLELQTIQTHLELELEKPIDKDGSICMKGNRQFSYACPSTYIKQQKN
ncbi:hypothetical protein M0812_26202 [Anaeramoeba flamelloides]|uniref:Uncharacterized protein n=1 Tax=Anaeramoeba flamelloides TaxID=1746091 RepID=A0AAV7YCJ2_9EUKA|nr:hypothetical protein M0812_26202 [Anaeramoeba flamelloides]